MRRVFLSGILALSVFAALACNGQKQQASSQPPEATPPTIVQPVDDGNGLYYFPVTGEQYRISLSSFYASNPNKHCDLQGSTEQVVYNVTRGFAGTRHTVTIGFILHCHDIAIEAQSVTVQ